MANMKSFDLNLLLALKFLVEERSVSRAAEKLFMSQPAMSHVLRRLRDQLDDPILVKTASGMIPTPRAQELLEPTIAVLREIERIIQAPEAFLPATSDRRFVIATSDYMEFALLPKLAESMIDTAPNIEVHVRQPITKPPHVALEEDNIDLIIGFDAIFDRVSHIQSETLFSEEIVCLTSKLNARAPGEKLTLEQFLENRHMLISRREAGTGLIDDYLTTRGLHRKITLVVPNFLSAPWILEKTDLLLCLPLKIAEKFVRLAPLKILPIPIDLPRYELMMLWHPRQEKDQAHMWLRDLLRETCCHDDSA